MSRRETCCGREDTSARRGWQAPPPDRGHPRAAQGAALGGASPSGARAGHALVGALAAATFLLASTGALVVISSSEERTSAAFRDVAVTRYAAEAAAERMILDLQFASSWDDVLSGAVRSSIAAGPEEWLFQTGVRRALAPETADLGANVLAAYPLAANTPVPQLFGWGRVDDLVPAAIAPATNLYFAAWISDDEGEVDGDPRRDSNARLRLHALAIAPTGARHELDVLVARIAPAPSPLQRLVWRGVLLD